jgi:hypothetical protein
MKPRKTCVYCHEPFVPYALHYRRQRACAKPECQRQRRRDTNRSYRLKNPYDADYRREVKKKWRQKHGRDYMRRYRANHLSYVTTNRRQQQRRDQRRGNLVKKDVWESLYSGKLVRIRILEESCKERLMRLLPE